MEAGEDMAAHRARLCLAHIKECLSSYKGKAPMIVGMQGPQGSGKTTICVNIKNQLEAEGRKVAVLGIDDLYKTHDDLHRLAEIHPTDALLQGRGLPGTHDMALGSAVLHELKHSKEGCKIHLPVYDKSAFSGQGDRSSDTVDVIAPLDVVLFEGWCLGFYPITEMQLQRRHHEGRMRGEDEEWDDAPDKLYFHQHPLHSLIQINHFLAEFLEWYDYIDCFIQIKPDNLEDVFAWRLQAEHAMKASGKDGMTDEQVHAFVARYMPGYELFGDGVTKKGTPWAGKGLQMTINRNREVINTANF